MCCWEFSWAEFREESKKGKAKWVILTTINSTNQLGFQILEILDIYESFYLNEVLIILKIWLKEFFYEGVQITQFALLVCYLFL